MKTTKNSDEKQQFIENPYFDCDNFFSVYLKIYDRLRARRDNKYDDFVLPCNVFANHLSLSQLLWTLF